MPSLNNQTVGDTYLSSRAVLQNVWNTKGGWFSVSGAAVFFQLQYGPQGADHWTDEQELGVGAFAIIPDDCTGVRFRNSVAGQTASVSITIAQGDEPALAIAAFGAVTISSLQTVLVRVFTANDLNYAPGAGCKAVFVECIGGGGGGGSSTTTGAAQGAAGAGGGGGGYAAALLDPTAWTGSSRQIGVGAGGGGGAPGGNTGQIGVASTFQDNLGTGLLVAATAGSGGSGGGIVSLPNLGSPSANGRGGVGTTGTVLLRGAPGLGGVAFSNGPLGGTGGAAAKGGGGGSGAFNSGVGNAGEQYGGGGGGGATGTNSPGQAGGAGAQGVVIITEYY